MTNLEKFIEGKVREFEGNFRLTVCAREDGLNDVLGMAEAQGRLNEHFESMKSFLRSSLHALLAEIEKEVGEVIDKTSVAVIVKTPSGDLYDPLVRVATAMASQIKANIFNSLHPSEPKED